MAIAAIDRETEVTYIRRERDWAAARRGRGPASSTRPDAAGPAADRRGHARRQRSRQRPRARPRQRPRRGTALGPGAPRVGRRRAPAPGPDHPGAGGRWAPSSAIAAVMLIFLGQDWEDALFWIFAAVMIGAGLLVVTMRDIIRCGLAMIVCFGALAGIYVLMGAPLIGGRPGHRLHRRDQRPDPVRDHAHPDEGRADAGSSSRPRPARRRSRRSIIAVVIALAVAATDWGARRASGSGSAPSAMSKRAVQRLRPAVRDRQRAAARGGHRRRVPGQARAGRAVVSDSLDAYLDPVRDPVRDRVVRVPRPAQRDQHADVDRADAQRGQPRRSSRSARSSRALGAQGSVIALMVMAVAAAEATVGPGHRHRHLPQQEDAARRRVRRDAPMSLGVAHPAARRPAAGRLRDHGAHRAPARQAGPLDPGPRDLRRLGHRDGRRRPAR